MNEAGVYLQEVEQERNRIGSATECRIVGVGHYFEEVPQIRQLGNNPMDEILDKVKDKGLLWPLLKEQKQ